MSALSDRERKKLAAMLALVEGAQNQHDGERIAALCAIERLLAKSGMRLRDLAMPLPALEHQLPELGTWRETCRRCLERRALLRPWEVGFLTDIPKFRRLSVKQRYCLNEIAVRVGVKERRAA